MIEETRPLVGLTWLSDVDVLGDELQVPAARLGARRVVPVVALDRNLAAAHDAHGAELDLVRQHHRVALAQAGRARDTAAAPGAAEGARRGVEDARGVVDAADDAVDAGPLPVQLVVCAPAPLQV